jgi:hypothetical protein
VEVKIADLSSKVNLSVVMAASPAIVIRPTVAEDAIAKVRLAIAPVSNAVNLKIFFIA